MAAAGAHLGSIVMEFVPLADRREKSSEIVKRIRAGIGDFPGAEVKVEQEREGPPTGAPVGIEVSGEDFDVLSSLADEILAKIRDVPGLVDLQEDLEDARPELQFLVDRDRAAQLGLDTDGVGQFLRAAVTGQEAGKFRSGEDEYDITVRVRGDQRQDANLLKQAYLTSRAGGRVPLASLGTFSYEGGRGQILRKDQKRMITISGTNQGRGVDRILEDVRARLATMTLPKGYAIAYAGDTQEMNEASAFLSKAFLVALALIALILIMEFNSVVLPFLVLMSVILSMAGVMWSLLASNSRFCVIMTGIAVVSLAGVVVNNGIVLIDCIVQRKKQGFSSEDAIVIGGRLRLRPVLLTAITTVVGLVPMAAGWSLDIHAWPWRIVGNSETAAFWAPMAVAVMYGLALATLLTLVQVPVMFSLTDSLRSRFREKDDETRG
jgi:multidrug efflux pump subunit AcrB